MSEDKVFNLDDLAMLWTEFEMRQTRHNQDKKWCEQFKEQIKRLSGDARSYALQGRKVAELRPGNLNLTRLEKEQPAIVTEYTRMVAEQKFDRAAFAIEQPEMFEEYRARALHLVSEPSIEGLQ